MKSYLPFEVKYSPIKKLAIIPFEKKPDAIYRGLELQFIDGAPYGTGYRVIAYRNDSLVDVYDDIALHFLKDEEFCVTENGLHKHVQTEIHHVQFCKADNNQKISFEFMDIQDRSVRVAIAENINRKSSPMNLLAPIGLGSKNPNYLPVFFLYEFDFIRKRKTLASLSIGERKKSVFCNWSKKYKYESIINWETKEVKAQWKNGNLKEKK